MAIKFNNSPSCTICGAVKQEVNHWWMLIISCDCNELHIVGWGDEHLAKIADGCACGEACAHKALSRWFESRTLDAPSIRNEVSTTTERNV
jgi:hypothetical protein